jgi:hypothetical protein
VDYLLALVTASCLADSHGFTPWSRNSAGLARLGREALLDADHADRIFRGMTAAAPAHASGRNVDMESERPDGVFCLFSMLFSCNYLTLPYLPSPLLVVALAVS